MKTILAATAIASLLMGCANNSSRTHFYTLAPQATASAPFAAPGDQPLAIELAPVAVPERLARPQLVVREGNGSASAQLLILEHHRWAASFENELRDALSSGIAARLGATNQSKASGASIPATYRISVQLRQFDAVGAQRVDTSFSWTLRHVKGQRAMSRELTLSEPVSGDSVDALAQATQKLVQHMADAIAQSIRDAQRDAR